MITISKPSIGEEEIQAVVDVLRSGMIAQGAKTKEFEDMFASICKTKYAVAVSNGTAALHTALYAVDIKPGDEVITTPFTFVATANPILMMGGRVVFADITEDDFCIDPEEIESKITDATTAIIPVDLYGQVYRYNEIKEIAAEHDLKIVEDACQAVYAEHDGVKAGNFGDIATFSLYATKNITTGEGGVIVTNNEVYAEKCKLFRHHGQDESKRYEYVDLGYNYRMTDISATIGIEQVKKLEDLTKKRVNNAEMLMKYLADVDEIGLPKTRKGNVHVYHQFTIRVPGTGKKSRDGLLEFLAGKEIKAGIYYPKPLHLHPHFMKLGYKKGDFPVSEKMAEEVLSLPVHPGLMPDDLKQISEAIKNYFSSK